MSAPPTNYLDVQEVVCDLHTYVQNNPNSTSSKYLNSPFGDFGSYILQLSDLNKLGINNKTDLEKMLNTATDATAAQSLFQAGSPYATGKTSGGSRKRSLRKGGRTLRKNTRKSRKSVRKSRRSVRKNNRKVRKSVRKSVRKNNRKVRKSRKSRK